jgi:hypothetical protein
LNAAVKDVSNNSTDKNPWTVTVSKDGVITIAMPPHQAQELKRRAEEDRQPLPLFLKHYLCMSDEPMPELLELRRAPGTYPPFLDQCARLGFECLLVKFSRWSEERCEEEIIMSATLDEATGVTATIAAKDLDFWQQVVMSNSTRRPSPPHKRRKKKPKPSSPPFRFPDSDAGHA